MKKIFYIAAIISAFSFQFSVSQAQDAVYKLLRQEWTVNDDGTSDYHYRHEVQILRNRALTAYADKGETFVVYNPDLEELTVNEVYTLQKDGTRIDMPQNAFVYQLPSECADCGRFNHLRELAMIHTGMELGCTIVVDYTIHRHYDLVNQTLNLVRDCPVERMEVSVKVPDGQELNVALSDPGVFVFKPVVEQTVHSYRLKVLNLPQLYSEYYLPAKEQLYPMLHFYNGIPEFTPAFDRQGLAAASDVANLQIDSRERRKNVLAIQKYVVENVHLNNIEPAMLGYVHSTAAEVWQSGCGTATDKAVLLAAMLNEVGYPARVLGDNYDEVGVMIDTMEYRLSVRRSGVMYLDGEAKDMVTRVKYNRNHDVSSLDTLEGGFYRLSLSPVNEAPAIDARFLALTRTAPLATSQCDIAVCDKYTLDKGVKLVGGKISRKLSFDGIGQVSLVVKQSGKTLVVDRKLKIEKNIITPEDYPSFRQLMAVWRSVDNVLLQSK